MDTHIALSLLIVDDSDDDALIAEEAIRRGGYTVSSKRVDTADGLKEALGRRTWDLILCDYRMPNFSGLDALSLVRQQDLDLPFILISGALGEETAVGALKAGANDYIMKGNPARLVPSVQRALREVRERQELRRAVDRLRASELLYRSLVETSPDAIAIVSLQGIILIANRQAGVIFHCPSPDALVGQRVLDLVVLAEREKAAANLGAVASGTDLGMRIYMAQRQDGTTFSVELQSAFIPSAGAAMADCIMMVARDVTERLRLAEHLRFQANLLATVGEAVIATDTSGNITYWNQAATAIYGWASDDVLGQNILSILPMEPSSSKDRITLASLARGASSSREYLARHRSGRPIPILVTAVPLRDEGGEVIGVIGVSSDNTARKTAEELLSSERDLLTTVMDALPDTVYVKDTQSRFVRVNTAQAQYLGAATPEETVGKTEFDYLPHARARALATKDQSILATGVPLVNDLENLLDRGHKKRWILSSKVPLVQGEQITGLVSISRDITALKHAEDERDRFFTMSLDLLCVAGLDGYFKDGNPAFEKALGFTPEEMCREPFLSFVHPDDRDATLAEVAKLATGVTTIAFENRYRCSNGAYRWLSWAAVPLPADGVMYATARDVTEQKEMEAQQRRNLARMSALHAINTAIVGGLDPRTTLEVVLEQVCLNLDVNAAQVLLLNDQMLTLEPAAVRGFRGTSTHGHHVRLGQGLAGRAALEQRLVTAPDLIQEGVPHALLEDSDEFMAYAAAPLIAKGRVHGVLEVFHRAPLAQNPEWLDFLLTLAEQAAVAIDNGRLQQGLLRSNAELRVAYDDTIEGWSRALDLRDRETHGHSERVTDMAIRIARALGVSEADLVHLRRGALLHDIGKMGIPDAILLKPGPLTEEEWIIMRLHPEYANDLLSPISFLRSSLDIPYCHHEKWDGTGYPRRLKGAQIPLAARMFAVADVADALLSDRPYRPGWSRERVRTHIAALSGSHFDPQVVACFLGLEDDNGASLNLDGGHI